jgi:phosphopantothenoylcysteine decarboxylase/phosphopantothenate--cysteine ligase
MKVALGVTGCIAAYKAVEVLRGLQKSGATVQVVMSQHATEFVAPLTFTSISGLPVITSMWAPSEDPEIKHIQIAQSIDLLLVAPATANVLAKFANGIADDFLSTLYISTRAGVLVAPAMNVEMWLHPATQENVRRLKDRGVRFIDPGEGYLACRTVGPGRLAEPDEIVRGALTFLTATRSGESNSKGLAGSQLANRDLHNEHVLVTAGPTYEAIDPVRGLTNRSSGRMGYAIAEAALARGARVTLVTGPVSIDPPAAANVIRVQSAAEMRDAVMSHLEEVTVAVMAAAVADYRPVAAARQKIKKDGGSLVLELEPTEDILAAVGREGGSRVLIGFAAETEDVVTNARNKLFAKGADLIVANDVSSSDAGFDVSTNRVSLVLPDRVEEMPLLSKREVADRIFDAALKIKARQVESSK